MSQVVDALEEARAASARQSWRAAYGAFTEAGDGGLTASDLENYGEAAWWSGKLDEAISLRERAYSAYTATGDLLGAARISMPAVRRGDEGAPRHELARLTAPVPPRTFCT